MSPKKYWKCYFKCSTNSVLHRFPHPDNDAERFYSWVKVLDPIIQKQKSIYIYNNLKLCDEHFELFYLTHNKKLTRNAVPTLNIKPTSNESDYVHLTKIKRTYAKKRRIVKGSCCSNKKQDKWSCSQAVEMSDLSEIDVKTAVDLSAINIFSEPVHHHLLDANESQSYDDVIVEGILSKSSKEFSWQQPEAAVELSEDYHFYLADEGEGKAEYLDDDFSYCSDDEDCQTVNGIPENTKECSGYRCNSCTKHIVGMRYVCLHCSDMDLCGACEAKGVHDHHYVLRVPRLRSHAEVCGVLTRIRQQLIVAMDPSTKAKGFESVQSKIKEEHERVLLRVTESNEAQSNCDKADPLQFVASKMIEDEVLSRKAELKYVTKNNCKQLDPVRTNFKNDIKMRHNTKDIQRLPKGQLDKIKTVEKRLIPNILRKTRKSSILKSNKIDVITDRIKTKTFCTSRY